MLLSMIYDIGIVGDSLFENILVGLSVLFNWFRMGLIWGIFFVVNIIVEVFKIWIMVL